MAESFDDFLEAIEGMTLPALIAAYDVETEPGPRLNAIADELELRGSKYWPKLPGRAGDA